MSELGFGDEYHVGHLGLPTGIDIRNSNDPMGMMIRTKLSDMLKQAYGKEILCRLAGDPRVRAISDKMLNSGMGSGSNSGPCIAEWYLYTINEWGEDEARHKLEEYLGDDNIGVTVEYRVDGLSVSHEIDLFDGIKLVPTTNDLPNDAHMLIVMGSYHRTDAAFVKTGFVAKTASCPTPDEQPPADEILASVPYEPMLLLQRIVLLCNAMSDVSARVINVYVHPSEISPVDFCIQSGPMFYPVQGSNSQDKHEFNQSNAEELERLYGCLAALDDKDCNKICGALQRLSLAKFQTEIDERVLDTTIALDIILTDRNDDKLTQSFALRGAMLVGKTVDEHKKAYKLLHKFYKYRSEVVHDGKISGEDYSERTHRFEAKREINSYVHAAEEIIRSILVNGFRDWDDLFFGAENGE